jgi:hypothetical protein
MSVHHLQTEENKAKAAAARRAARPALVSYAKYGLPGRSGVGLVHRLRAEKALGRPLPTGCEVHHANGTKRADSPLVICQDNSYHKLLHNRMRIKAAGGDPNTQKLCSRCKQLKPRSEFNIQRNFTVDGLDYFCRSCVSEKNAIQRTRRKAS